MLEDLDKDHKETNSKIEELNRKIKADIEKQIEYNQKTRDALKQLSTLRSQNELCSEKVSLLEQHEEYVRTNLGALQAQLPTLDSKITSLKNQISQKKMIIGSLKATQLKQSEQIRKEMLDYKNEIEKFRKSDSEFVQNHL